MVSVIVPIYNVGRYLPRALDSILSQTYKGWEAILVDDGSTDKSGEIADEYAQKDPRFRVIHKENGGRSAARNAGMEHITGQWVVFLDADDFLHPQLMELCLKAAGRDDSDMIAYTYDRTYRTINLVRHFLRMGDSKPRYKNYIAPEYLVTEDIFQYATEYSKPKDIPRRWAVKHCQVWRCMYRASRISDIKFIKGINYEDFPWWSEVLLRINRCTILNLPLYFYYPNPQSYVLSTNNTHKAISIKKGLETSKMLYATAPENKKQAWERNFLAPFEQKLKRKESDR